ncbi:MULTISPECIES: ABC transporter ATP-binding protein [Thalassospira]|jgi:branched-chain amino acid transport system ATP-binding protein|uniref:ABC transporter ATP-binding protein n=1 Tax=Thalassospira TaxID=168934 RepID=UPI000C3900A9|nr:MULTISPECIES: ABC transporter ATP-binding protein [Thalassospira]MAZ33250.1 ABC transporter ATP-binding protein [Thalassospira sp.]WOI10341.1 ABC transporter ATP-binding protein [Thalassospira lucentensis]|tara:strand:- start:168 stop:971 length:804 start_codon:yes stop_codon:yes gene_type:complete
MTATGTHANPGNHQNETKARVVLTARDLRRDFGGFTAVNNVNLDVHHAKVHALIGPNGAGKTTVFNLLTKFLQPTSGKITLLDHDITKTAPARVARMGLVRSFQISAIFPHLTVLENIRVALQRPGNLAIQFWQPLGKLDVLNDRAMELLESVGLQNEYDSQAADLSYGRKRVLEIATTLALDPKVLLLDEPMAGMGGEDVGMVAELIREVAKTRAVLMVEHNLNVVADLCDHITVLQRGEILAEGDYATVSNDERVKVAYMGTDHD